MPHKAKVNETDQKTGVYLTDYKYWLYYDQHLWTFDATTGNYETRQIRPILVFIF